MVDRKGQPYYTRMGFVAVEVVAIGTVWRGKRAFWHGPRMHIDEIIRRGEQATRAEYDISQNKWESVKSNKGRSIGPYRGVESGVTGHHCVLMFYLAGLNLLVGCGLRLL